MTDDPLLIPGSENAKNAQKTQYQPYPASTAAGSGPLNEVDPVVNAASFSGSGVTAVFPEEKMQQQQQNQQQRGGGGYFVETPMTLEELDYDHLTKPMQDESRLLTYLMSNYDREVRPVFNVSETVQVHVGITLTQIFDMVRTERFTSQNSYLLGSGI